MLLVVFALIAWVAARQYFILKEKGHLAQQKKPAGARIGIGQPESFKRIVVVTGGQGFLGQHVVSQACEGGYYTVVRVYDRVGVETRRYLPNGVTLEVYVGDLVDEPRLQQVCEGAEAVLHTAALVDTRFGDVITQRLRQANVEGTAAVVRACLACGVRRLAHVSSIGACFVGPCATGTVWNEATADFGTNISKQVYVYGRTKAAGELLVRLADGQRGLATVAVRPHYIFGSGDLQAQVIKQTGKPVPLFGPGHSLNTVVYVKNCAGWLLAAEAALRDPNRCDRVRGKAYFIGDGDRSVKQMNELLWRATFPASPYKPTTLPAWLAVAVGYITNVIDTLTFHQLNWRMLQFSSATVATMLCDQLYCTDAARQAFAFKPVVELDNVLEDMLKSKEQPLIILLQKSARPV